MPFMYRHGMTVIHAGKSWFTVSHVGPSHRAAFSNDSNNSTTHVACHYRLIIPPETRVSISGDLH